MSATIRDVAKAAGVSQATISRFFNDRSRVKEDTASHIEQVVRKLNYVPSATARNLAIKQTDVVGVLISQVRSAYWNEVYGAIHDYLSQHNPNMEVFSLNCDNAVLFHSKKNIQDKVRLLAEQRVAGIILLLRKISDEDVDYICELDIPFVVVQSDGKDERISSVNIDNHKASYNLTKYLLSLGHKNVAYVSGPLDAVFAHDRFAGYRDAMVAKGLYRKSTVLHGDNSTSDGYWRTKQILTWDPLPTAIVYASDTMAFGGMQAINGAGYKVPDDFSVAGFDGFREQIPLMDMLPPLTTVIQPMKQIGEKTAEIMMQKIKNKGKRYNVILPTSFVDNGSCRAL